MSLEGLFALPCTARVTTFFLSPCFYQTAPLRARSLLRALSPRSPLGSLGNPSAVFGSHSLEIFLSRPFTGLFPGGQLQPLPALFRALQPPGFSSRRRVGVPRNLPSHTFLSIFFRKFLRENILKSKKISDYQYIIFLFFSNKKASLIIKEA